jgi:hypothetical protein
MTAFFKQNTEMFTNIVFIPVASRGGLRKPRILDYDNRTRDVLSALPLADNTQEMDELTIRARTHRRIGFRCSFPYS